MITRDLSAGRRQTEAMESFRSARHFLELGNMDAARKALAAVKKHAIKEGEAAGNLLSAVEELIDATFASAGR